ncbi:hypothetical protein NL676_016028 [Syzygium grande]|nr:hypothetical protein NL676_016028 [Syzygium grande]
MGTPYPTPVNPAQTRIGWIGIGVMGASMAARLISAGYALTIYSRDPSKALRLQSLGALLADSPRDVAARSDVVFTMVGHPSDVRSIVLGPNGILSGLNPGGAIVDTTSSHPDLAREIFNVARGRDCWAIDAPVSGGDIGARDGKLAIFAGGDHGVVEWLRPLFDCMGKVTHVGKAGCGQSCKIANQILVGANLLGLSEGLVFAERAGLDVRQFVDAGGFAEYMVKDLGMGVDVVEGGEDEKVVVLPGAAQCKQLFSGMVANGDGHLGTQGLISVIQRINGIGRPSDLTCWYCPLDNQ